MPLDESTVARPRTAHDLMTLVLIIAALLVTTIGAAVKGGPRLVGSVFLVLGLVAISWNAVRVGPLEPGDALLLAAAFALALDALRRRRAPWMPALMLGGAALIAASGLLTALAPPSASYLSARTLFPNPYVIYGLHSLSSDGNLASLGKFLVALVLLPMMVQVMEPSRREVRVLAGAWAVSALISAGVAVLDASGHTHISASLLGYVPGGGRQAGLSIQPNHLAVALILATPVVLSWMRSTSSAVRLLSLPALLVLAAGVLLTSSRGGFVGLLIAAGLTIVLVPELRPSPRVLAVVLPLGCMALLGLGASLLPGLATQSRLASGLGDLSDAQRTILQAQAIADFSVSPIHGIGFDHVDEAHQVFLQLLAAGGVIGLLGYLTYWIGVLRTGLLARRVDPNIASVLLVSSLCFLALNLVENQVTDRYLYVPAALIAGLAALRRRASESAPARELSAGTPLAALTVAPPLGGTAR
ncbi:MAG TPA: O-antigen ligase family protein [Candidatus Dormibacteraeota bacterium]